jgi:hypothetical protein
MENSERDFTRQAATVIGDSVEKTSAYVIEQVEDLSLWMMEQAAEGNPNSEGLTQLGDIMHSARQVMSHVPRLAGSLAAGSTYFGLRLGGLTLRVVQKLAEPSRRDA